jgi:hypothetical protein
MSEAKLVKACAEVMCLSRMDHDESVEAALKAALDVLGDRSGLAVARAFIAWQAQGMPRRDPRPAPMREVGGTAPPLRKREPFLAGGL